MRILFISDCIFNPTIGGIERVTDLLARQLSQKGHSIFYLCEPVTDALLLDFDCPANVFFLPETGGYHNVNNQQYYYSLVNEYGFDIVVNQRGWAPYFNGVMAHSAAPVINVVHTVPDGLVRWNMNIKYCYSLSIMGVCRAVLRFLSYPLYQYLKKKKLTQTCISHYQYLVSNSKGIVFLSDKFTDSFRKFVPDLPLNFYVQSIPNPTPRPSNFDIQKKEKVILFVGRMSYIEKRPDRLLKVWERLHSRYPEWKILFVGDGEYRQEMEEYVRRKSISNVYFEGLQPCVNSYYRRASAICLTSNFEGWGMCLVEGMSFACVPVAFNSFESASDIISDGVDGYLVKPFSISDYADKLEYLINNEDVRLKMAKSAVLKAAKFCPEKIAQSWENLFLRVRPARTYSNG